MNMKKLIFVGIMLIYMLLAGCSGEGNNNVGPATTPFVGGTTGLSLAFLEGAPPERVLDNNKQEFSITLSLENLGEADVPAGDGYIEISGLDPTEFGLTSSDIRKDLPNEILGIKTYPGGSVIRSGRTLVEFEGFKYVGDLPGNWYPRIRANLCYNYVTNATVAACVKEDMLSNIPRKEICELSGEKTIFNSGAPIQVTKVTQTPLSDNKIQLQFTIAHVGETNDRFFKTDTECDDRTTNEDKDKVYFEVLTDINGNIADCSGLEEGASNSGYIKLWNGAEQIVTCNFEVGDVSTDFEKLVNVRLAYRYYQFVEKNILIEDI